METTEERKEIQQLIAAGKEKGFLTFDEVNDALPPDVYSPEEIDDMMMLFAQLLIQIVDTKKEGEALAKKNGEDEGSKPIRRKAPRSSPSGGDAG